MQKIQQQRQEKQKYLREQILDKQYDPTEFTDYCETVKGDVNIDLWSFVDLVQLVNQFIQNKQKSIASSQNKQSNQVDLDFNPFSNPFTQITKSNAQFDTIQSGEKNNNPQLNFEFIYDNQPSNNAPLDLDFLSEALNGNEKKNVENKNNITLVQSLQNKSPSDKNNIKWEKREVSSMKIINFSQSNTKIPSSSLSIVNNQQINVKTQGNIQQKEVKKQSLPTTTIIQPLKCINNSQFIDQKIQCKKLTAKSLIINFKSQVVIETHEIVNTNVFVPDYVLYHIKLLSGNSPVKRRFKDFEILRDLLKKLYPASRLPHLQKYSALSQTESQVIKKTKFYLECFLNDLLINKELNTCRIIEEFLTIKDSEHMKKKFKQYQKIQRIRSIEELNMVNGEIDLKYTNKHKDFNEKLNGYIEMSEAYYQKLRQLYDQLSQNFQATAKTLLELNDMFLSLEANTKTFNSQIQVNRFNKLENTYKLLAEINQEWSSSMKAQVKILEAQIKPKFKFEKENLNTIRELIKTRNNISQALAKRNQKQFEKITQKYTSKKLQEYKISVDSPSKSIIVLKYQNAFFNSKLCEETEKMFLDLSSKLEKQFKLFCNVQASISGDMKTIWIDFMNFYK